MDSKTELPTNVPLFRPEVTNAGKDQWLGPVLLDTKLSPVHILAAITALLVLCAFFVLVSSYSRTTTAPGVLVPDKGLIRIFAPFPGVASNVRVTEGQSVKKGDPLLTISVNVTDKKGLLYGESILKSLHEQYALEAEDKKVAAELAGNQLESVSSAIEILELQKQAISREIELTKNMIAVNRKTLEKHERHKRRGLISDEVLLAVERELFSNLATLERLWQNAATLDQNIHIEQQKLIDIPLQNTAAQIVYEKNMLQIQQQILQVMSATQVVITAPVNGVVSSLVASNASSGPMNVPLLTIIPDHSKLVGHLYAPSRSIGLIEDGDVVTIRYEAYPYQRFGLFKGRVRSVSQSALAAPELPPQLVSFTSANSAEPLYRIVVDLNENTVRSGMKAIELQTGLRLEADISLDSMPLYQWLLKPVISSMRGNAA